MKIIAPIENVNGIYASVLFVNSVGETDNPALIHWFKKHGYRVEPNDKSVKTEERVEEKVVVSTDDVIVSSEEQIIDTKELPDFDAMTPNELRDWIKANGYGSQLKNIRNKDKLLEIIKGAIK